MPPTCLTLPLATLLAAPLAAQVLPPSNSPAPAAPPPSSAPPPGNPNQPGPLGPSALAGSDWPEIDPVGMTMQRDGQTTDLRDNQLIRSQLVTFLNQAPPPLERVEEYREIMARMLELMDAQDSKGRNPAAAWALLSTASGYELDGDHSANIAAAIAQVWNAKRSGAALDRAVAALDEERTRLERGERIYNDGDPLRSSRNSEDNNEPPLPTEVNDPADLGGIRDARLRQIRTRQMEIRALRAQHVADEEVAMLQSKIEFQVLIGQLFAMRRFEHCRLASAFYRYLFRDADSSFEFNQDSEFGRFFSEGVGTNPTVNALEAAASEAINKVGNAVEAFHTQLDNDQMYGATERITEAVILGEFLPEVQMIPVEARRKTLRYLNQTARLLDAINARDWQTAETALTEVDTMASDFVYTSRINSQIVAHKNRSNQLLLQARAALASGDNESFNQLIEEAGQYWPTNPAFGEMMDQAVTPIEIERIRNDFSRLYADGDYRAIFGDSGKYAMALQGDTEALAQLEEITRRFGSIEATLQAAETYHSRGQSEIAWEITEELLGENPSDSAVLDANRRYQREVSEFVSALRDAEDAAKARDYGSALAHYFEAQREYPSSTHAQTGIDKIVAEILPE